MRKHLNSLLIVVVMVSTCVATSLVPNRQTSLSAVYAVQAAPLIYKPLVYAPQTQTTTPLCIGMTNRGYECVEASLLIQACPPGSGCSGITGTLTLTDALDLTSPPLGPISDTLFAVDTGPNLDRYLFGENCPTSMQRCLHFTDESYGL